MNTKHWMVLAVIAMLMVGCAQGPATVGPGTTPVPEKTTAASPSPVAVRPGVSILADGVLQAV